MRKSAIIFGSAVVVASLVVVGSVAFAAGPGMGSGMGGNGHWNMGPMQAMPGVFGTVSAVNGTTLTVTQSRMGFGRRNATSTGSNATTTYTVDATNATVIKNGATSTVSAIATGDTVMVRGTVSGTSVTATSIFDGMPAMGAKGMHPSDEAWTSSSSRPTSTRGPPITGNGEPVVGGTITAINGSTLTVTNKSNVTYTVDASGATVVVKNTTSSLSAVSVNDNVLIQGTVNGNSVTATSVLDQGAAPAAASGTSADQGGMMGRMLGGIGSLFHRIFGFF